MGLGFGLGPAPAGRLECRRRRHGGARRLEVGLEDGADRLLVGLQVGGWIGGWVGKWVGS